MNIKLYQRIILGIFLFMLGMSMQVYSQDSRIELADSYYNRFSYDKAAKLYEKVKEKTPHVYRNLAQSYLMLGKRDKAESTYKQLMDTGKYSPEDVYNYAKVLLLNRKYDLASDWMQKYYKLNPKDRRAQEFMEEPDYYKELVKPDPNVKISNLSINSPYQDFSAVYYKGNQIVFASSRGKNLAIRHTWNGNNQPYLDLYIADLEGDNSLSNVRKFDEKVNKKYHDAPATFNAKGDYMVVTRNVYGDEKLKDNKLMLYESRLDGGSWTEPVPISTLNSTEYSTGHATLTPDGEHMYFASDRPGGYGGSDIYRSDKQSDGSWSPAVNAGPQINTEGNEMFPFYDDKGQYLFFSSDGHPGLGGLDLFVSKIRRDGSFTPVVNLGAPVNTNLDDFGFVYKEDGSGFISSNRIGGKGDDDIYSFTNLNNFKEKVKDCYLSGVVKDKETGELLSFAKVHLLDEKGNELKEYDTKADGRYEFPIDCNGKYQLVVLRDGYVESKADVDASLVESPELSKDFYLETPEQQAVAKMCDLKFDPIYYDLDKYYIRYKDKVKLDKIIEEMNKYPQMVLEVGSHTDSRASHKYNMVLSKNRTKSVVNYLVNHGISKDRIIPKWYGETRLVNGCSDGVKCSEEEHQLNRRTEFKVANCDKEKEKEKENEEEEMEESE